MAGNIDSVNYKTGFASVEEEIDFLNRICAIEDYYNVSIAISDVISEEEYRLVLRISDLIMKDEVKFTWTEASFTGNLDVNFRKQLNTLEATEITISHIIYKGVKLFGARFELYYL